MEGSTLRPSPNVSINRFKFYFIFIITFPLSLRGRKLHKVGGKLRFSPYPIPLLLCIKAWMYL